MKHRIFGAVAAMLMIVGMVVLAFSISAFAVGEIVEKRVGSVKELYAAIDDSNVDKIILTGAEYVLPKDTSVTVNRPLAIVGDDVGEKPVIKAECSGEEGIGLLTFGDGSAGSLIENVKVVMSCPVGNKTYVVLFNNYTDSAEKTVIRNVDFIGGTAIDSIGSQIGIAASGSSTGGNVEVTGCTFTNFAYGLYLDNISNFVFTGNTIDGTKYNAINVGEDGGENIVISDNTFINISYANYSENLYSSGISIGSNGNAITVSNNEITMLNDKSEVFVNHDGVMIGDTYYIGIEEALAAAKDNDVIKLSKDVAVNEMVSIGKSNLTFDLNGFTLRASEDFTNTWENGNDSHLLQVLSASNVTVKNGKLVTTAKNRHALNIYESAGVVIEGLGIDHTETREGAPIVINASEVTVQGKLNLTVGKNSWYGINVDPKGASASLAFAAGSQVEMNKAEGVTGDKYVIKTDGESAELNISGTTAAGIPADMIVGSSEDGTGHAHTPATEWSTDGDYHWYACTQDGCAITFEKVAHTFGEEEIVFDENGHWEVCESCDEKLNWQEHRISAAWYYDEENHWHQCLGCGYMIDIAPHNAIHAVEDDPYFVSDATCTEGKKYYRSCECGCAGDETFTVGDPLGHSWETVPAKDATCTEEGWNEHQACTVCGETEGKETVPALGHSLVKTDRKDADCVNAGNIEYYTCSTCGKIYRDADGTQEVTKEQTVIAALGHRPGSFVVEREATCAQAGTQAKYCTVCNAEVEREEIPALAHTFGDWTVVKEATEKEKGQEERVCSVCQFKETRDIDALGGGLSTGAIVGIVVAVVVVLAGGGFCIYWFVIRKKKS